MPRQPSAVEAMTRLVDSEDFERVLRSPSRARTVHFAVHHLPARADGASEGPVPRELSTISALDGVRSVDDSSSRGHERRLGVVVPKRHARRAVTRSLLKRQARAAASRYGAGLSSGLWVVRLRASFDRTRFPSAASAALRVAAGNELKTLFEAVARSVAP